MRRERERRSVALPRSEDEILLLHNPKCSKSRATLALLEERDRLLSRLLACLTFKDVAAVIAHRFEANNRYVARLAGVDDDIVPAPPAFELPVGVDELAAIPETIQLAEDAVVRDGLSDHVAILPAPGRRGADYFRRIPRVNTLPWMILCAGLPPMARSRANS